MVVCGGYLTMVAAKPDPNQEFNEVLIIASLFGRPVY